MQQSQVLGNSASCLAGGVYYWELILFGLVLTLWSTTVAICSVKSGRSHTTHPNHVNKCNMYSQYTMLSVLVQP